jgi:hypothetical protein
MEKSENILKRPILSVKFWGRFGFALICGFGIGLAIVGILVLFGLDGIAQMIFAWIPLVSIVCSWGYARQLNVAPIVDESKSTESGTDPSQQ